MEQNVRVRFAAAPAGVLAVADAHVALFNWLFARSCRGVLALRLTDTDLAAVGPEAERGIYVSLKWLGLDWDEGPVSYKRFSHRGPGGHGPYRQSERLAIYRDQLEILKARGLAYPCFCLPEKLEAERRERARQGLPPVYAGRCARLSPAEVSRRLETGPAPAWRLAASPDDISWSDRVRGPMTVPASAVGDLTLLRANGRPGAAFAAAVDDHLMAITHVIAPDRHLARAPGQIMITRAFGWEPPLFAHLPLITGPDHKPLAARHGAATLDDLYQQGFLPEAVTAGLALLGWAPDSGDEITGLETLARSFDLDRLNASPAAFDLKKLESINGRAVRALPSHRLAEAIAPHLRAAGLDPNALPGERLVRAAAAVRERLGRLADAPDELRMFFEAPAPPGPEADEPPESARAAARLRELLEAAPDPGLERVTELIKQTGRELGLRGPDLYMPIRMAISGRTHGPDLAELMAALGRDEVIERLRRFSGPGPGI